MRAISMGAIVLAASIAACSDDVGTGGGGQGGDGAGGAGGADPGPPAWQVVFADGAVDRVLLSVWGTSSTSVYAVGGPLKNSGFEAAVLHYDGESWTDLAPGGADTFWWVNGTSDTDVWMVGENGRITHYDGAEFSDQDSSTTATLWGAVAFAEDDVWAVGGMVGGPATTPDDVVLHYDGTSWQPVTLPGEPLHVALFKVWGTSDDDLFVVGEAGVIWHKQGADWTLESDPPIAGGNLTTVNGCSSSDVYAVGGRDVLHYDGTTWTKLDLAPSNDVNGVSCVDTSNVAIAGTGGLKQRYVDGAWNDDFTKEPHGDLHAVWGDETGAYWVVGGDFFSTPKPNVARNGILARYGPGTIPTEIH